MEIYWIKYDPFCLLWRFSPLTNHGVTSRATPMRVKWIYFDLEMYIGTSALWDQEMQYILGLESESWKIYCHFDSH